MGINRTRRSLADHQENRKEISSGGPVGIDSPVFNGVGLFEPREPDRQDARIHSAGLPTGAAHRFSDSRPRSYLQLCDHLYHRSFGSECHRTESASHRRKGPEKYSSSALVLLLIKTAIRGYLRSGA